MLIKTKNRAAPKTRREWAARICALHKQAIDSVLEMGRALIAAKRALEHGEFTRMIERELPFDASTAQRLMKVARDPRIRKAARAQLLPAAWGTLYELTKMDDATFEQALKSGAINQNTTRNQAAKFVKVRVTYKKTRQVVPYYVSADPAPMKTINPLYRTADDNAPPLRLPQFAGGTRNVGSRQRRTGPCDPATIAAQAV